MSGPQRDNCPKCGGPWSATRPNCSACHAAYMREWRKTHPLNPEQRKRDISRSIANVYKKRGVLVATPCAVCDSPLVEMHHIDHERPLEVTWLCRECHLAWHTFWRTTVPAVFNKWLMSVRADLTRAETAAKPKQMEDAA